MKPARGSRERSARIKALRERMERFAELRQKQGWKTWHWALDESRSADNGTGEGVAPRHVWTEPGVNAAPDVRRPPAVREQTGRRRRTNHGSR